MFPLQCFDPAHIFLRRKHSQLSSGGEGKSALIADILVARGLLPFVHGYTQNVSPRCCACDKPWLLVV